MVFFACNSCGESIKKNKVDIHKLRCSGCRSLACIDCGKDFPNNEYKAHNKCITEDEKYGGKNYIQKPNVNKAEKKRDEWVEALRSHIERASFTDEKVKLILEKTMNANNVPQKEKSFENFLKGYAGGVNRSLFLEALVILQNARKEFQEKRKGEKVGTTENGATEATVGLPVEESVNSTKKTDKKKQRRAEEETARAAVDSQESNLNGAEENNLDAVNGNVSLSKKEEKRRKRKHVEDSIADVPDAQEAEEKTSSLTKKEKKKKQRLVEVDATEDSQQVMDSIENDNGEDVSPSKKGRKRMKQKHADDQNANENEVVIEEVNDEDTSLTKKEKKKKQKKMNDEDVDGHTDSVENIDDNLVNGQDDSVTATEKKSK